MANNPYVNKVVYGNDTLIDLTDATATADKILQGYTAYGADGSKLTGTATGGGSGDGYVWQDAQGYVHLSDEEGTQTTIDALTVDASGTYTAQTGHAYSPVTVPNGSATTPTTSISVTPSISVNSSGLITASASGSKSVTPTVSAGWVSNGTAGTVSVSGSNTSQLSTQAGATITPTTSEQTAVAAGKYTTGAVKVSAMPSGTAGTPTATKGTVSNHSISVTPSVTNSTGYITGGTKTGTAVTVSASELDSGTKSITANGTGIDVVGYASVDVAVQGGGGYDETLIKNFIERSSSFTSFDFPSGITQIGDYAFTSCMYLAISELPSTITAIGSYAFSNCQQIALTSLPSGISSIESYAFENCNKLALTSLPSGITRIGNYAFHNCYLLSLTALPSTVTSIGSYAFNRCESITSISCSGAITAFSGGAFNGSSSYPMALTSASFPNMALTGNLAVIFGATTAANACQQLAFADIGKANGIAANSFANCYSLQTLVLRKTSAVCTLANVSAFLNTPMRGYNSLTGTVYVPSALISSYQTATNWSTLYNDGTVIFVAIEGSQYEL